MSFCLSSDKKAYSEMEADLFRLLPQSGKPISSTKLMEKYFENRTPNYYAKDSIRSAMRGLMRKVAHNNEPFSVMKSRRRGPVAIDYWLEER